MEPKRLVTLTVKHYLKMSVISVAVLVSSFAAANFISWKLNRGKTPSTVVDEVSFQEKQIASRAPASFGAIIPHSTIPSFSPSYYARGNASSPFSPFSNASSGSPALPPPLGDSFFPAPISSSYSSRGSSSSGSSGGGIEAYQPSNASKSTGSSSGSSGSPSSNGGIGGSSTIMVPSLGTSNSGSSTSGGGGGGVSAATPAAWTTKTYSFSNVTQFTYDANFISCAGGTCKLAGKTHLDSDNSGSQFGAGTKEGVAWNSSQLELSSSIDQTDLVLYLKFNGEEQNPEKVTDYGPIKMAVTCQTASSNCPANVSTGKYGNGASFDGTNDIYSVNRYSLPAGLTYSAWIKTTSTSNTSAYGGTPARPIIGDSTGGVYMGFGVHNGKVRYLHYDGGWQNVDSATSVADGSYHMVTVSHALAGGVKVYVDGVLDASGTIGYNGANCGFNSIGTGFGGGDFFSGSMDEVLVWSRVLTDAEVLAIYSRKSSLTSGQFTSQVFNAGGAVDWQHFLWTTTFPTGKSLPKNAAAETGYATNNVDMNGNVLLFKMDETSWNGTSGEVTDDSGKTHHGTSRGGGTTTSYARFTRAGRFDGTNDGVTVADHNDLDFTTAMSVEAWVRIGTASNAFLVAKGPGLYQLTLSAAGKFSFALAGITSVETVNTFDDGRWHHVVGTYDKNGGASNLNIYVDGGLEASATTTVTDIATDTNTLGVGYDPWNMGGVLNGDLDEVALYSRALTFTEVSKHDHRGVSSALFQVRGCNDNACAGETFVGSDGTSATYFEDLGSARALVGASFQQQYIQYRAIFDTDRQSVIPAVTQVQMGPELFNVSNPTLTLASPVAFTDLRNFTEILGADHAGSIGYQISLDGTNWNYNLAGVWVAATNDTHVNTAAELNTEMPTIATQLTTGNFYLKIFLKSAAGEQSEIDEVSFDTYR